MKPRGQIKRLTIEGEKAIAFEYRDNASFTLKDLARKYGMDSRRVRRICLTHGVAIRFINNFVHRNPAEHAETARRNLIEYNKSEEHRQVASLNAQVNCVPRFIAWAKSETGKTKSRETVRNLIKTHGFEFAVPFLRAGLLKKQGPAHASLYVCLRMVLGDDVIAEYHQVSTRTFIDIVVFSKRVAIEIDDTSHFDSPTNQLNDARRQKVLEGFGWSFIRFTEEYVRENCQDCVRQVLTKCGIHVEISTSTLPLESSNVTKLG